MIEVAVSITVFLVIVFGVIEFSYIYFQWNAATKAVQWGARMAAVSSPVANDLTTLTGLSNSVHPGDPMPSFDRECTSDSDTAATGTCTNNNSYNASAMRRIVFGDVSRTACNASPSSLTVGMCNLFEKITPRKVTVRYQYTGLGYAGRPCGAVPTVTVSLTGLSYQYIFLSGLAGLVSVNLPGLNTTVTGEDLRVGGGAC